MNNLYNNVNLCRYIYAENKLLHCVDITYEQGVMKEIIQQEVKSMKNRTKCDNN